jgi:hypothetical protein
LYIRYIFKYVVATVSLVRFLYGQLHYEFPFNSRSTITLR